jgi:hydrogenase expression/formation protein HypD
VENEYSRVVRAEGNIRAQKLLASTFETADRAWRGFPVIPLSALVLKNRFEANDSTKVHEDILENVPDTEDEPKGCRCGEVLRGLIRSEECPMFGTACDPNNPMGPCMVSHEGGCNIAFRFRG